MRCTRLLTDSLIHAQLVIKVTPKKETKGTKLAASCYSCMLNQKLCCVSLKERKREEKRERGGEGGAEGGRIQGIVI
eukprot:1144349-Pelagomonas_calceolata.AAC.8